MSNDSTSHSGSASVSGAGHRTEGRIAWSSLLVRAFLVLVPAQVLGFMLGIPFVVRTGLINDHGWVLNVVAGLVAGLALGLLLRPGRPQLPAHVVGTAVVGVAVLSLLLTVSSMRLGAGYRPELSGLVLGVVLAVGVQTLLAVGLWMLRAKSRS